MRIRRKALIAGICILCLVSLLFGRRLLQYAYAAILMVKGKSTVADRVEQYADEVKARLAPDFERIGTTWPGTRMILIGLKSEKLLQIWIADHDEHYKLLRTYPILKASGQLGPKLKEGDRQVPEGLYAIESLNPNSRFHLSLRVNYPNAFDQKMARQDGRTDPGSDIMIHGGRVSIGCLAMGDPAAEDLFVLASQVGLSNITVILTPVDFRKPDARIDTTAMPPWAEQLYERIKAELDKYVE